MKWLVEMVILLLQRKGKKFEYVKNGIQFAYSEGKVLLYEHPIKIGVRTVYGYIEHNGRLFYIDINGANSMYDKAKHAIVEYQTKFNLIK